MVALRWCFSPPLGRCGRRGDELLSLRYYHGNGGAKGVRCATKSIARLTVWYTLTAMGIITFVFTYIKGIEPMLYAHQHWKQTTCMLTQPLVPDGPNSVYGVDMYRFKSEGAYYVIGNKTHHVTLYDRPFGANTFCNEDAATAAIPKLSYQPNSPTPIKCYYDPADLSHASLSISMHLGNSSCLVTPQSGIVASVAVFSVGLLSFLFVSAGSPMRLAVGSVDELDADDAASEAAHKQETVPLLLPPPPAGPPINDHSQSPSDTAVVPSDGTNIQHTEGELPLVKYAGPASVGLVSFDASYGEQPSRYEFDVEVSTGLLRSRQKLWRTVHQSVCCCCVWPLFAWVTVFMVVMYVGQGFSQFELGYNDDASIGLHAHNGY